jgi:hypothetical protein
MCKIKKIFLRQEILRIRIADSSVDRHRFVADPDPAWHKNNADPHADPTPILSMLENQNFIFILSQHCQFTTFFSHQCHNFQYFGQFIEIF